MDLLQMISKGAYCFNSAYYNAVNFGSTSSMAHKDAWQEFLHKGLHHNARFYFKCDASNSILQLIHRRYKAGYSSVEQHV